MKLPLQAAYQRYPVDGDFYQCDWDLVSPRAYRVCVRMASWLYEADRAELADTDYFYLCSKHDNAYATSAWKAK